MGFRPSFGSVSHASKNLDLSRGGTFSRALQAATYLSAPTDGSTPFLSWVAPNVRRSSETRGDGVGPSLLMEKQAINFCLASRDLTQPQWSIGGGAYSLTANNITAPDGGLTAVRAQVTSFSPGQFLLGTVESMWVRAKAGTSPFGSDNATVSHFVGSIGTTWTRLSEALTTSPSNWWAVSANYAGGAIDCGIDLLQSENGIYPTSPIITTTVAVTRPGDSLSYSPGAYPIGFLTNGFTVVFAPDASSAEFVTSGEDWHVLHVGTNDYLRIRGTAGVCKAELICGGSIVAARTVTFSRAQALTLTAQPSLGSLTVAGATTGNGTDTTAGAAWASATIYIGSNDVDSNHCTGRFVGASISGL